MPGVDDMSTFVSIASDPRIANSVRLIFAMFRLVADIESGFGKAILDILKRQFPDQDVDANPAQVGHKMMAIALKELQRNPSDAMDAIQDWLTYVSVGYGGDPDNPQPYPFDRDHDTWQSALKDAYTNLRKRSISKSRGKFHIEKEEVIDPNTGEVKEIERQTRRERGLEETYGRRTDEGKHEKAEERMPAPEDTGLGKALDDQAAIKEFMDLMDEFVPQLLDEFLPKRENGYAQQVLFKLIFEQGVGTFESDIKANMAQATELKKLFEKDAKSDNEAIAKKAKGILSKYGKRWSGFVGDTRKKLLDSIQKFVEKYIPPGEYDLLWDTYFADVSPVEVEKAEAKKIEEKENVQLEKDVRKYGRLKWKEKDGKISDKEKKSLKSLTKKLKGAGVDIEAIELLEPGKKPTQTKIPMVGDKVEAEEPEEEPEEEPPVTQRMDPAELEALSREEIKKEEEEAAAPTQRWTKKNPEEVGVEEEEEEKKKGPKTERMPAMAAMVAMVTRIAAGRHNPKYL